MAHSYLESLMAEHEKVVFSSRQHWFILAGSILLEIVLILAIISGTVAAAILFHEKFPAALIIAIGFLLVLIPTVTMVYDILIWSHKQYIVTNRRVIQIAGVLNKNVTDSSLEKVNDVKMSQSLFGRIFNYGDIEILTASEMGVNLFRRIAQPVRFKTAMLNAKQRLERENVGVRELSEAPQPADIPALIEKMHRLRQQGVITEEEFQRKKAELLAKM